MVGHCVASCAGTVLLRLALFGVLPVLGGCLTSQLYDGIRSTPRLKTGGYPVVDTARFQGELAGTRTSFGAYYARDPLWTGKDVSRRMTLLVPADRGETALAVTRSVYPGEMRGDQDRIAACAEDARLAEAVVAMGKPPTPYVDVLVWVSGQGAASDESVLQEAQRRAEAANAPGILVVLFDRSSRYRTLRAATRGSPGSAESGWRWSPPASIEDCLPKPTGGWTFTRIFAPLGFLLTVPIDIVTSPIQLAAAVMFLITFNPL